LSVSLHQLPQLHFVVASNVEMADLAIQSCVMIIKRLEPNTKDDASERRITESLRPDRRQNRRSPEF